MTQYADYGFYREKYGGTLTEEQFAGAIIPASAYIRRFTFGRAEKCMEEVQYAACACCDLLYADHVEKAAHGGKVVASESTDGYSISYVQEYQGGETPEAVLAEKAYQTVELYLEQTGLLDMGVY